MVATYVLRSNWIKSLRITSQIWLKVLCFLKGNKSADRWKKGNGLKKNMGGKEPKLRVKCESFCCAT